MKINPTAHGYSFNLYKYQKSYGTAKHDPVS
jgi:hypothetical protein